MSGQQTTSAAAEGEASTSKAGMSLDEKIGMAKKFDREMKDYAKATVKEFLGIYGYEEDADINIDESETQKANETSQSAEKFTETQSSTTTDCDNLGCKTHLETPGTHEARAVVMIETYDANEVSEITNVESTSRAENGSSNPDLPSNEILKFPCSTETLAAEVKTSEFEEQCEKQQESQGELCRDVLGSERESHSEMCGSQWTPGETLGALGETLVSQGKEQLSSDQVPQCKLGTLGGTVGCRRNEQLQSTETVQEVDHLDNEVLTSQNTDRIQNETLEQHSKSVSSFERLETCAVEKSVSEETTLTSVRSVLTEKILEELGRTAATLVDGALEMPQALPTSTLTPSEILDAITQIIPLSQPVGVVLQEHSYASVEGNSGRILQDVLDSTKCDIQYDIHTHVEPSSCEMESSLISGNQSCPMNISDPLQDALSSSRNERNQGSNDIPSTPDGTTDITVPGLKSTISNKSILETVQPQKVESDTIQRSDDIPLNVSPRPSEIAPTEIATNTLYLSANIRAPRAAPDNESISGLETIQSRYVQSCSSPVLDDNSSNDSNQRILNNSNNTPGLRSTTEVSGTLQPPTLQSNCDSSLEAGQYKTRSTSPKDSPDSKEKKRLSTKKHRENETAEKRERRLKTQRERTRIRRLQENETEREARREKDRKRQQLKRTRNKESGDILSGNKQPSEDILHTASQTVGRVEDRGLPNTISQSSNSVALTASTEGRELHCSSVSKPAVIPISEDTNIVSISEDTNTVPISEDTNTVPSKRPKMMQDPVSTNTLVSSESRNVIDGQQLSQSDRGDLCHRGERSDVQGRAVLAVTEDIPSSVLQREDRDVTEDNSNDLPENREDLDIHRKIDLLNNRVLSGLPESATSQTTSGLSASQEDKDIPDHVGSSVIETSSVGSKLSITEGDPALPRVAPCEGGFIGETSSTKLDGSAWEEDSDDDMDTLKQKNRDRVRRRRALETPEQRETRLKEQRERVRERRANETDSQRETRRVRDRIRKQITRTSESAESRSKRLLQHRDAMRRKRALESPEETQMRRLNDKDRAKQSRESKRAGVVVEWWKK